MITLVIKGNGCSNFMKIVTATIFRDCEKVHWLILRTAIKMFHKCFTRCSTWNIFWKRFLKTNENCYQYFTIIFLVSICYKWAKVVYFYHADLLETASYQRFSAICLKKNDLSTTVNNLTIHNTSHYNYIEYAIFHYTQQYPYINISTSTYHKNPHANAFNPEPWNRFHNSLCNRLHAKIRKRLHNSRKRLQKFWPSLTNKIA